MIMQEKPQIIFIQETKCNSNALERIAEKAWPGGLNVAVDANGASGGLAVLWDARSISLSNIHANRNFIQAIFHITVTNTYGHLTNVYFPQDSTHKIEGLSTLSELNSARVHPLWIVGGDFNMITRMEEKRGGRNSGNQDGIHLKDLIQKNWLIDMPFNNSLFTWNNKRTGMQQISSPGQILNIRQCYSLRGRLCCVNHVDRRIGSLANFITMDSPGKHHS